MDKGTRYRGLKMMGASYVIHLAPVDIKDFGWKLGDMIDISDCIAVSKELYDVKLREGKRKNIGDDKDECK